ncbi:hypothetical protein H1R20_g15855, partial [Candolleomyces eurysporus]
MNTNGYLSNSPFHRLLGANDYPPSPSEGAQVKTLIQNYLNDLEALDLQISEAQLVLDQLNTEHREIDRVITTHQGLIHPVRLIPREILTQIFIHSLPSTHLPVISTSQVPLSLTQVCRIWRAVALSTPSLWASIHIPIPRGQTRLLHLAATRNRRRCLTWWLDGAKGRDPLSISLHWPKALQETYGTRQDFPRTIITYSHHIRELELDLPDDNLRLIINTEPQAWPALEKLTLRLPSLPGDVARGAGVANASIWRAPMLRRVVWESVDDSFFQLPVKYESLKEIVLAGSNNVRASFTNPLEFLVLFHLSPNVETLRLQLTDSEHRDTRISAEQMRLLDHQLTPDSPDQLVLPNLTTLDLADMLYQVDDLQSMLTAFRTPALATVKYSLVDHSPPVSTTNPHPFRAFLSSQPGPILITSWTVSAKSMSITMMFECLRLMPLLKTLWVEDSRSLRDLGGDGNGRELFWTNDELLREVAPDDGLLQALLPTFHESQPSYTPAASTETRCPRLERLRLDRTRCSLDGIRDFVHTRLALCTSSQAAPFDVEASTPMNEGVSKLKHLRVGLLYPRPQSDIILGPTKFSGDGELEDDLRALGIDAMILFNDDGADVRT